MAEDNLHLNTQDNTTETPEQEKRSPEADKNEKPDGGATKAFLAVAVVAIISVMIVLGVALIKNFTQTASPDETLKKCVTAAYEFDIDTYARYSTMNDSLRKLLLDSDYDYDATYAETKAEFDDVRAATLEEYGEYDAVVEISNTHVYSKNTKKYKEYLELFKEQYSSSEKIEAFCSSTVTVYVEYMSENGEISGEEEEQEIYGVLVEGAWYLVI